MYINKTTCIKTKTDRYHSERMDTTTSLLLKCKFWSLSLVKIVKPKLFHSKKPLAANPTSSKPEIWKHGLNHGYNKLKSIITSSDSKSIITFSFPFLSFPFLHFLSKQTRYSRLRDALQQNQKQHTKCRKLIKSYIRIDQMDNTMHCDSQIYHQQNLKTQNP